MAGHSVVILCGHINSFHPILQTRRVPAAHYEGLACAAQVDFRRVVERLLNALDEFDIDDGGSVDAGEILFEQSFFPFIQGFEGERLFPAGGEDFAVDIGGADAFDIADAQKTRRAAEREQEQVIVFERSERTFRSGERGGMALDRFRQSLRVDWFAESLRRGELKGPNRILVESGNENNLERQADPVDELEA